MKRILLGLALTAAAAVGPAFSQEVSIGIKAGPNFATLAGDDVEDAKSFASFIGGGFMVVEFSPSFALQPELLFVQKGAKAVDPSGDAKLKIDYIELPILLRLQPASREARFVPHLLAGPTIAYNTSCNISGEAENVDVDIACDEGQFDLPIKNLDFGLALGGGVDMSIGTAFLVLDARYEFGLTKIDDSDDPSDVKHRGLGVMAGVRIPFGTTTRSASRNF